MVHLMLFRFKIVFGFCTSSNSVPNSEELRETFVPPLNNKSLRENFRNLIIILCASLLWSTQTRDERMIKVVP